MNHAQKDSKRADQIKEGADQRGNLDSLLAIGCSQVMMLWIVVALVGYAVSMALNMGGSGQGGGAATILAIILVVLFGGSSIYASYVSGHARPVIRGLLGILAWIAVAYVGALLVVPFREYLWAAVPLIATGAMLAIVLPATEVRRTVLRILVLAASGLLVVLSMLFIDSAIDAPFEWWIIGMSLGYALGLGVVYGIDRAKPG